MEVIKINGIKEKVSIDKVTQRIEKLCWELDRDYVDPTNIALEVIKNIKNGISTEELDFLAADICAAQISKHPDFNKLAARICVSNLHKTTDSDFLTVINRLYHNKDNDDKNHPLISELLYDVVNKHHNVIQAQFNFEKDFKLDYFGIRTLERSYLIRIRDPHKRKY